MTDDDDDRRRSGARIAARAADVSAPAGHVRARRGRASVRRRGPRVSRPALGHRRRVARPRASGAGARDRRAGADADPHVEPVLSPAAGTAGGAAGEPVGAAARVLLQQRHRSGRGVPEVRAPLLVHAGRAAAGVHRARGIVPRPDVRVAVGHLGRALPRAVRAAAAGRALRAGQRPGGARGGRVDVRRRRSSPSRFRAKAASGR